MSRQERLTFWLEEYQRIIRETLSYYPPFFQAEPRDQAVDACVGNLNKTLSMMSDSIMLLVINGRLWDASMLHRVLYEGTTKFLFLCTPDRAERLRRIAEFEEALPDIANVRDHKRAEALLSALGSPTGAEFEPVREVMLDDAEIDRIGSAYSREDRARLEQRWSFSNMVAEVAKTGFPGIDGFGAMLFGYSLSSHLLHMDGLGLGMIIDREARDSERQYTAETAHAARLVSDLIHLALLRAAYANWMKGLPIKHIVSDESRGKLLEDLKLANAEWHKVEYPT